MAAVSMAAEHGAWQGLQYDIASINQRCDQSSERVRAASCHERRWISADLIYCIFKPSS